MPERIWITGCSGAGKTTLAKLLSQRLGIKHIELDALYHGPNWSEPDPQEFRARVLAALQAPCWIVDGNYRSALGDLVAQRTDLKIAIDLPKWLTMRQVVSRTLRRTVTREELWNGNREPLRNLTAWDPRASIIRWSWTRWAAYHARAVADENAWRAGDAAAVPCVRLTSRRQLNRFVSRLTADGAKA